MSTASTRPSAARGATRRSRAPRSAFSRSATPPTLGPEAAAPGAMASCNTQVKPGESMRVFPLSNWTELDVWDLHLSRGHSGRAALFRRGAAGGRAWRHADHARRRPDAAGAGETPEIRIVRFRTLGCYPLTGAIEEATTLARSSEMRRLGLSERQGRAIDHDSALHGAEEAGRLLLMPRLSVVGQRVRQRRSQQLKARLVAEEIAAFSASSPAAASMTARAR